MLSTLIRESGQRLDAGKINKLEIPVVYDTRFSCATQFVSKKC